MPGQVIAFLRDKRALPIPHDQGFVSATTARILDLAQLKVCRGQLPPEFNPRSRETYLADSQFEQALGVRRCEFGSLPQWRRDLLKASAELLDGKCLDAVTVARFRPV